MKELGYTVRPLEKQSGMLINGLASITPLKALRRHSGR